MKTNITLLILLLIIGITLGVFYHKKLQEVDYDSYTQNVTLINHLKNTDSSLNVLMLKSRYGLQADYDELAKKSVLLGNSFAKLKQSDFSRYAENNALLGKVLEDYEEQLVLKIDLVESFKSHNAVLRNSINYAPPLGDQLIADLVKRKESSASLLKVINQALYRWSLYGDTAQAKIIQVNSKKIFDLLPLFENEIPLLEYNSHVLAVVDEQEQTQLYLQGALAINTDATLTQLNDLYTKNYLDTAEEASQFKNYAIIAYGLLALFVAFYFAWMLRKSYLGLEQKDKERTQEINNAYRDVKESQEQMIQSEKMASLGQMVAGVAHEINTPLGYVNNNVSIVNDVFVDVEMLMQKLGGLYSEATKKPYDKAILNTKVSEVLKYYRRINQDGVVGEAKELLDDSSHGLKDIAELVTNLRSFSRLDRQAVDQFDVCDGLDSALKIANSILKESNVDVVKSYGENAVIECNPSKINQVFLNIITNAAQAIPKVGGQITIHVEKISDTVSISFTDTGEGMSAETRAKIFDPFFTTKPVGEGTGLGMSIIYKIVQEHNGQIEIESNQGKGTTVKLLFPCAANDIA